jgi:DNA-binding NarL/FixJ family response regulator
MANFDLHPHASDGDGRVLKHASAAASHRSARAPVQPAAIQLTTAHIVQELRETLLGYQNLSALLETILARTMELSQYNGGSILLLSGPLGPLEVYASLGDDAIAVGTRINDLAASVSGYVLRTQYPLVLTGRGEEIGTTWRTYTKSVPAAMCMALPGTSGSAIGVLTLKHTRAPHALASEAIEALQLLVARYAVMIELAHLRDTHTYLLQGGLHAMHASAARLQVSADSQLAQHIREIVNSLRAQKVKVTLDEMPLPPLLPPALHSLLVEIVQQSLAIIRTRSMMTHAHIMLRFSNSILSLEVRSWDDAYFLSTTSDTLTTVPIEHALAEIARLREQVAALEGDSSFQIEPGVGTLLTVTMPVMPTSQPASAAAPDDAAQPTPFGTIARLVLADPHCITRTGLRMIINTEPHLTTIEEVASTEGALATCRQHQPDLLLLGLYEPLLPLEAFLHTLRRISPATRVLLIVQPHLLQQAAHLREHVPGYLSAAASSDELLHAVRQVVQGTSYIDPSIVPQPEPLAAPCSEPPGKGTADNLTRREYEVLHQLAQGKTNRQIADNLSIGAGTVKTHVEHIIAKLQVSDRTQAAVRAFELGLLSNE